MSSTCANKEAAWEFIRTVLTDTPDITSTPIKKDRYELQKITAMHVKQVADVSPEAGEIRALPLTEEQIQRFEDFFNSIDKIVLRDMNLVSLVREITAPYFAGDRTLDDTVALLQNRVQLYVNEKR